jgi:hypothetical protein
MPYELLVQIADTLDPAYWQRKTALFPRDVQMIREFIA